jgi:hypothetical protein
MAPKDALAEIESASVLEVGEWRKNAQSKDFECSPANRFLIVKPPADKPWWWSAHDNTRVHSIDNPRTGYASTIRDAVEYAERAAGLARFVSEEKEIGNG